MTQVSTKVMAKILAVYADIQPIVKDSVNPHFKSKYFDINAVVNELRPLLVKHEVSVIQPLDTLEGKSAITTIVSADGESMAFTTPILEVLKTQELGSSITYMRRYCLVSLFLLEGEEDDDANGAKSPEKPVEKPKAPVKPIVQPKPVINANGTVDDPLKDDTTCVKCGVGMMVKKTSARGDFIACDQYPTCKNILKPQT